MLMSSKPFTNSGTTFMERRSDNITKFSEALSLAFILEASGYPKPGNVHRLHDRKALRYEAFLATGVLAYKFMKRGVIRGLRERFGRLVVGDLVYGLVRDVITNLKSTNTCLGSSLALSLMAVATGYCVNREFGSLYDLSSCAKNVLTKTTIWDTIYYYMAIRKASPSYLKPTDDTDEYVNVWDPVYRKKVFEKGHKLVDVLHYSSKIDVVAREVVTGFEQGIEAENFLRSRYQVHHDFNRAIVETYLYLLSKNVDTVIRLKHGLSTALAVMENSRRVLETVLSLEENWISPVASMDEELRKRDINPGSIADVVAEVIGLYMIRNIIQDEPMLDLSH